MPDQFHIRIQAALANASLQEALDANANRRLTAHHQAFTSLGEDYLVMRQRAHAIRTHTISNLEKYLQQFVKRVKCNGLIVHHARDSEQALQIVMEIIRHHQARLVAKAKTMVSEEIGLNRVLEAAGIEVVETDLGEFIVQLRGEPPAHIITPAVHLRRSDVGRTFQEKLNIPYTEDVPTLTAAARDRLRQTFLAADVGISGVNFGVVENGTLCLVTNEGNGRMVTTIPPVHIALMGIERLVPTMDDLALMLALLPRAATGQKISVYTSLIHAPRQPGDADGPRERHLVLVDNGRMAMRNSSLFDALLCIRCGACLNACPVFREIGGHSYVNEAGETSPYPGPIGSVVSPGLFGQTEFGHLARASSLCGACKEACPVDIDLPKLLLRVRGGGVKLEPRHARRKIPRNIAWGMRVYALLAVGSRRFAIAQRIAGMLSWLFAPFSPWLRLPGFTGWGLSKDLPRPAARPFRDRWAAGELNRSKLVQLEHSGSLTYKKITRDKYVSDSADQRNQSNPMQGEMTLVQRFTEELTALGGTVTICQVNDHSIGAEHDLANRMIRLLEKKGINSLQSWDEEHLPIGLLQALLHAGIEISQSPKSEIAAGLSGALAGIAETGTLAVPSGPGRPLTASLLPEIHLAILRVRDIYANLSQVLNLEDLKAASSIALISGPSRTGDIEMTLSIGVHGPREVHVFCLLDEYEEL